MQAAEQVGSTAGVECWQVADASQFMVRGKDYMQTRKKVASKGAIYRSVSTLLIRICCRSALLPLDSLEVCSRPVSKD